MSTTVYVAQQPMTVIRHNERDENYVLETQDGFKTRRYYAATEISVPCSNGCGNTVSVLHSHEVVTGATCSDCFERLTVPR